MSSEGFIDSSSAAASSAAPEPSSTDAMPESAKNTERGARFWMRLTVRVVNLFGRPVGRGILAVVALYYTAFHASIRRWSMAYQRRIGLPAGFWPTYRQVLRFAQCGLDRVFFLSGRSELFAIELFRHDLILEAVASGKGCILLGAHLGSFEAMRLAASTHDVPINVVMNTRQTRMYNEVLSDLDPDGNVRIVEIGDGGVDFMLRLKAATERGELVAIMGDRAGDGDRSASVDFLGAKARFPTGAYYLAATLRCPVLLTFGLYRGGNRYDLYAERFTERVVLPRGKREEAAAEYAAQYAERLAAFARMAPDNWFNFFDFWDES